MGLDQQKPVSIPWKVPTNLELELQRKHNQSLGFGLVSDVELNDQISDNAKFGRGGISNAQVEGQRADNLESGAGAITNTEAKAQRIVNRGIGYGKLTDAEVQLEQKAHTHAGLGNYTTSELTEVAVSAVSTELVFELKVRHEAENKLRSTWFECFGKGFVHGSAGAPCLFPPGPIPQVPPPLDKQIKAVLICMHSDCEKSFGIFTRRHTCNCCGAVTCNDCLDKYHGALERDVRVCPRCCKMCDEWLGLYRKTEVEWAKKEATAQVAAARDVLASSERAVAAYMAHQVQVAEAKANERRAEAARAAKQAAERLALKVAREKKEQTEFEEESTAAAAKLEEEQALEQAAIEESHAVRRRAAVREHSIAAIVASEMLQASKEAKTFQVPPRLESMVDDADMMEAKLHKCNEGIRQSIQVGVSDASSISGKSVAERNETRLAYAKAATELLEYHGGTDGT